VENFSSTEEIRQKLEEIAKKYGLKLQDIDATDVTPKARLTSGKSSYVQVYFNIRKNKFLLALIQNNQRIYGFDRLDENCHEHPFDNPKVHREVPCSEMDIEKIFFKVKKLLKGNSHGRGIGNRNHPG
jgi:hypothetical protein